MNRKNKEIKYYGCTDIDTKSPDTIHFACFFRYKKRASHVSRVLKLRPRPPFKEAADLVEYVHAVGNLDHLKPKSMTLPFYEMYMLDVIFVLGLAIAVVSYVLVLLCRLVCCKVFGSVPSKTKMS